MALIPVRKVIEQFQTMFKEHWPYEKNAACKGCVDCSGAFHYVWKLFGKSIPHGSNAIERSYIRGLLPISEARPGMAAFKRRQPGEPYYDLPDKYKPGGSSYNGDLSDYYHIGLVDDDPNYVLNAQSASTGFVRSPISKNWCGVGYLKDVQYDGDTGKSSSTVEVKAVQTATVIRPEGATGTKVHFRSKPESGAAVVDDVVFGNTVEVLDDTSYPGWAQIRYRNKTGYMMAKFLSIPNANAGGTAGTATQGAGYASDEIPVKVSILESMRETLNSILGVG